LFEKSTELTTGPNFFVTLFGLGHKYAILNKNIDYKAVATKNNFYISLKKRVKRAGFERGR